jgi:hypothetical protein
VYANLRIYLKSGVNRTDIKRQLSAYLNDTSLTPAEAVEGTDLTAYAKLVVGAARFPSDIKVIYLCLADDEIQISVYGKSIPQIKTHCSNSLKRIRKMSKIKISNVSASILISYDGTDIDILAGKETSWLKLFFSALADRWLSKGITALLNAGGAYLIFKSSENPTISAAIALVATAVGILFEAIHSASRAESWSWSESK